MEAADTNSQTYLLKILEIPGKSVTDKYITVLKDNLDKRGLKYSINIVVDENITRNMQHVTEQTGGGGDSTYPYNLFESKIDSILAQRMSEPKKEKGWLSNAYDKIKGYNQKRQGIMDRLFSYTPIDKLADATEPSPESPIETPPESLIETPPESPIETPPESPIETPPESPIETPPESPIESSAESPIEPSPESPIESPPESPTVFNDILREDDVLISTNIDLPENYTGVLYIQLTIYDQSADNTRLVYGIYELNNNIIL